MNFCKLLGHAITISLAKTLSHMAVRVPKLLSGRDRRFPPSGGCGKVSLAEVTRGLDGSPESPASTSIIRFPRARISLIGLSLVLELPLVVLLPKIRPVIRSFIFATLSIIKTQAS